MSSPDFFDEETHSRLALEANGGVCSILVSNILIQAQRQQSTGSVVEVYNPDTKDFTLLSTENNQPRLLEWFHGTRDAEFYTITDEITLDSGLKVELGFFEGNTSSKASQDPGRKVTLAARVEENTVLPIADFYDMRDTRAAFDADELGPLRCSYAVIKSGYLTYCDNVITTTQDEQEVVLAARDSRGLVFAKELLEAVQQLQESRGDKELQKKLFAYLNIEDLVIEAFSLEPGRNYGRELRLRKRLGELVSTMDRQDTTLLLNSESVAGPEGPSTDRIEETWLHLDDEGHQALSTNYRYPEAFYTEPREILRLSVGSRIGKIVLSHCVDASKTAEQAVDFYCEMLSPEPAEENPETNFVVTSGQMSGIISREHANALSKNKHIIDFKNWAHDSGLDQILAEGDITASDAKNILRIGEALIEACRVDPYDLRLVQLPNRFRQRSWFITTRKPIFEQLVKIRLDNVPVSLPDTRRDESSKRIRVFTDGNIQKPIDFEVIPRDAKKRYRQLVDLAITSNGKQSPQYTENMLDRWLRMEHSPLKFSTPYVMFENDGDGRLVIRKSELYRITNPFVLPLIEVPTSQTHKWAKDGTIKKR